MKEVLSQDRKASILWQCSLEEKEEQLHLHPIGEVEQQVQGQRDQVLAKTANPAIRLQLLIILRIINPLSLTSISAII